MAYGLLVYLYTRDYALSLFFNSIITIFTYICISNLSCVCVKLFDLFNAFALTHTPRIKEGAAYLCESIYGLCICLM